MAPARAALRFLLLAAGGGASARRITLGFTGDINLPPGPPPAAGAAAVWGDLLPAVRALDGLLVNHEAALGAFPDPSPNHYKFEDQGAAAFRAAGVAWVGQANNHQFDFWGEGARGTVAALDRSGLAHGGLGSPAAVRRPTILTVADPAGGAPVRVAVFSLVAQLCHKNASGADILSSCTCGVPSGKGNPSMPPLQCYPANASSPGLWYLDRPVSDAAIADAADVIRRFVSGGSADIVIAYLHAGPNFEWDPSPDREMLLRNLSLAGADVVWGTSSHHIQRTEVVAGRPVMYGIGDLMFRFVPGVDTPEQCEVGMSPCAQFRPDVSAVMEVTFDVPAGGGAARVAGMAARPTQHDGARMRAAPAADAAWLRAAFNRISEPYGATMRGADASGRLPIDLSAR